MNILLTSGGRRVALLKAFRAALKKLGQAGQILVADLSPLSSAYQIADIQVAVPRCLEPGYVDRLLDICTAHEVKLLVPLIDTELAVLAAAHDRFKAIGTTVVISSLEAITLSRDKRKTATFFESCGLATPKVLDFDRAISGAYEFPLFLKPADGSSSIGSRRIDDVEELRFFWPRTKNPMLLECLTGVEYTVDVYSGLDGTVHCAVPRRRVEVRAGEVSKGLTEQVPAVIEAATKAAKALPGARGVLTFQCMLSDDGTPYFFELNARFGGGAPLSIHAGADFPRWLLEETQGRAPSVGSPPFRPRTLMLRYDDAVFLDEAGRWL